MPVGLVMVQRVSHMNEIGLPCTDLPGLANRFLQAEMRGVRFGS